MAGKFLEWGPVRAKWGRKQVVVLVFAFRRYHRRRGCLATNRAGRSRRDVHFLCPRKPSSAVCSSAVVASEVEAPKPAERPGEVACVRKDENGWCMPEPTGWSPWWAKEEYGYVDPEVYRPKVPESVQDLRRSRRWIIGGGGCAVTIWGLVFFARVIERSIHPSPVLAPDDASVQVGSVLVLVGAGLITGGSFLVVAGKRERMKAQKMEPAVHLGRNGFNLGVRGRF